PSYMSFLTLSIFLLLTRTPSSSILFPYTTLFRSPGDDSASRNTPSGKYSVRAHSIAKTLRHDCDNYFSSSPDSYRCSTITRRFGAGIAQRLWPISFRRRRVSCLYRFWAGRHGRFLLHRWSVTTTTTGIRGHPEHLGNLAGAAPSWYHRHFHPWRRPGSYRTPVGSKRR